MKKFFIPIVLISFCTIICGCSPKNSTNTDIESITDNPQIITGESEVLPQEVSIETQNENSNEDSEIFTDTSNENIEADTTTPNTDTDIANDNSLTDTTEKLSTDEIIDKLTEYGKSGDFDEEGVDILYQIIDSLSE